jgi:hypothetical protein
VKRTDLGEAAAAAAVGAPRRDFLSRDDEETARGAAEARAKSSASDGSLGYEMVEAEVSVGGPWNWEARSSYCVWRLCSVSARVRDALVYWSALSLSSESMSLSCCRQGGEAYAISPAPCNRIRSLVMASIPSRRVSSEREMCPS